MSNRPTYVEDSQRAASSEPATATKPIPHVKFSDEGEAPSADKSEETKMPTPKGAGFRFGRRSTVRMTRSSAAKIAAAGHTRKARVIKVRLSAEMSHHICQNKRIAIETHGAMWVDTGANTTCAGAGFTVLAYSDRYVTLRGYSDSSDEEERVPVVTAAMAIDLEDGIRPSS